MCNQTFLHKILYFLQLRRITMDLFEGRKITQSGRFGYWIIPSRDVTDQTLHGRKILIIPGQGEFGW
jgi:hypothetical protein